MSRDWRHALVGSARATRIRRFVIVGTFAAGVQTVLLWLLVEWVGLFYLAAAVVAIEVTIVLQFVVNNSWTFRPAKHTDLRSYGHALLKTNAVRGTAIPIQTALLWLLATRAGIGYIVANLGAIFVSGFYRYYLDSRWTWSV
jgi:putative flippase GtrA